MPPSEPNSIVPSAPAEGITTEQTLAPARREFMRPGMAVALLGIFAAIFSILPPDYTVSVPGSRALWIAGFFLLGIAEIAIIYRASQIQDQENQNRFAYMIARFEQLQQASDAHNASLFRLSQNVNDPKDSLKRSALQLSESILRWIQLRIHGSPPAPPPGRMVAISSLLYGPRPNLETPAEQRRKQANYQIYEQETLGIYTERFASKVEALAQELEALGLSVDRLRKINSNLYASPDADTSDIIRIGDLIGELAEQIDDMPKQRN